MTQPQTRRRAESFSDATASLDAQKILYVFNAMTAQSIIDRLAIRLQPGSASDASSHQLLLDALKANGFANELAKAEVAVEDHHERHCARCHGTYLEKDNAKDACVIKHAYPVVSSTSGPNNGTSQGQVALRNTAPCPSCRSSMPCASSCIMMPTCFAGRHTTNPSTAAQLKSSVLSTCVELRCGQPDETSFSQAVNLLGDVPRGNSGSSRVKADPSQVTPQRPSSNASLFDFGAQLASSSKTAAAPAKVPTVDTSVKPEFDFSKATSTSTSTPHSESNGKAKVAVAPQPAAPPPARHNAGLTSWATQNNPAPGLFSSPSSVAAPPVGSLFGKR